MARAWLEPHDPGNPLLDEGVREFHTAEWDIDPTLLQEAAFAELPPPSTDLLIVGGNDVGAVKDFSYPWPHPARDTPKIWADGAPHDSVPHRWTRPGARLRIAPSVRGPATITLRMGVPFPGPQSGTPVRVRVNGQAFEVTVTSEMRDFRFEAILADRVLEVRLDAPVWNRSDQPMNQGIRVETLAVSARP